MGPPIWNYLPLELKQLNSLNSLKSHKKPGTRGRRKDKEEKAFYMELLVKFATSGQNDLEYRTGDL